MRLHQRRTCSRWTIPPCIHALSVAHANGSKASRTINAHPVGIRMARHPRRSWSSRRTQDDQRPTPTSSAAVVAQQGVLLPMHLQRQGAESVTIDLARVTVPESPPVAVLPLPPSMDSLKAKNGQFLTPGCLSFLGCHLNGSAMAGPRRPAIRARVEAA